MIQKFQQTLFCFLIIIEIHVQELNLNYYLMITFHSMSFLITNYSIYMTSEQIKSVLFVTNALNGSHVPHILNQSIFFFIAIIIKQYFQWKKNNWILTICSSMKKNLFRIFMMSYRPQKREVKKKKKFKQKSIILKITCNLSFDDIFFCCFTSLKLTKKTHWEQHFRLSLITLCS